MGNNRKQQALKKKAKENYQTFLRENYFFRNENGTPLFKWTLNFDPHTMSFRLENKSLWQSGQLCFTVDSNKTHYFIFKKFIDFEEGVKKGLTFPSFLPDDSDNLDAIFRATCNLFAEVLDVETNQNVMVPAYIMFKLDDDEGKKHGQNHYLNWTLDLLKCKVSRTNDEGNFNTRLLDDDIELLFQFIPKGKNIFYLNPWTINKTDPNYERFTNIYFNSIFSWVNNTFNGQGKKCYDEVMRPYFQECPERLYLVKRWYGNKTGYELDA